MFIHKGISWPLLNPASCLIQSLNKCLFEPFVSSCWKRFYSLVQTCDSKWVHSLSYMHVILQYLRQIPTHIVALLFRSRFHAKTWMLIMCFSAGPWCCRTICLSWGAQTKTKLWNKLCKCQQNMSVKKQCFVNIWHTYSGPITPHVGLSYRPRRI